MFEDNNNLMDSNQVALRQVKVANDEIGKLKVRI